MDIVPIGIAVIAGIVAISMGCFIIHKNQTNGSFPYWMIGLGFLLILVATFIAAASGHEEEDGNTKTVPEPRIFKIETKPLGSGTVVQTATNATSFIRIGVVRMTSSYGENLLGDRIVLMGSDIKVNDFVSVNRIIVGHDRRELYRFPVAEKEKTNKVSATTQ